MNILTNGLYNKNTNVISISHNDLDGVSCQMLLNNTPCSVKCITSSYNYTLYNIKNIKNQLHLYNILIITDLVLSKEILEYLIYLHGTFSNLNIYYIDHHVESNNVLYNEINRLNTESLDRLNINIDLSMSATKNLSNMLTLSDIQRSYVEAVDAFDIWNIESNSFKLGMVYNTLFWNYNRQSYFSMFKKDTTLLQSNKEDYKKIVNNKNSYFNELESKNLILKHNKTVVIFGDDFQNWTSLHYKEFMFNIQVFSFGKILVKINKNYSEDICVQISTKIMETINNELLLNSGGHHHILSLTHTGDKDYDIIIDYTKKIYKILSTF